MSSSPEGAGHPVSTLEPPPTGMEWTGYRLPGIPSLGLTELGPIQKFSCWMYFTLSYTPLFFSTYQGGQEEPEP